MTPQSLDHQIQDFLDGTLDEAQAAALVQKLKADPEALDAYCDFAELESSLLRLTRGEENLSTEGLKITRIDRRRSQSRARRMALLAAAAAVVLVATVLRMILVPDPPPLLAFHNSADTSFHIIHDGTRGEDPAPGTLEKGSRLTLHQGATELIFASGVRAIVKAPADLTVQDEDLLHLHRGVAWFKVPKNAVGFRVQTEELLITDLGTEFGVISVADAGDEIHVLDGRVLAANRNGLMKEETLAAGQARTAGPAGRLQITPTRRDGFLTTLPNSLPHLHWSFDGEDPLQVDGTLPEAKSITTRQRQSDDPPAPERIVPGKNGNALLFDHDHREILTDWKGFEGRTPRTFACWIKLHPNDPGGWGSIAEWGSLSKGAFWRARVVARDERSTTNAVLRVGYGSNWIDGETNLADGNWHHVAIVESEAVDEFGFPDLRFYVDGNEENLTYLPGTKAVAPIETRPGQPLVLGRAFSNIHRFRGSIDELFLFEGTLSPASIRRLMTTHQP